MGSERHLMWSIRNRLVDQDNFESSLKLIDFGLATSLTPQNRQQSSAALIGTPRYASWRAHQLFQPRRMDDLVSLFYTFYEMALGALPWTDDENCSNEHLAKMKTDRFSLQCLAEHLEDDHLTELASYLEEAHADDKPEYDFVSYCFLNEN